MESTDKSTEIYQLRIWIRKISPQIRRHLLERSGSTIAELHDISQVAFGWSDDHLHRFLICGKPYGIARIGGTIFDDNPRLVQLRDFHFRLKETWRYEYDLRAMSMFHLGPDASYLATSEIHLYYSPILSNFLW